MHRPPLLTKILATLGPASSEPAMVRHLVDEGVSVFRLNFSHGSFDDFERLLVTVREASRELGKPIGVLGDLCGPKLRLGDVQPEGIDLEVGDTVVFFDPPEDAAPHVATDLLADQNGGPRARFSLNQRDVLGDLTEGHRLLIDDGYVRTLVTEIIGTGPDRRVAAQVTHGGKVTRAKGVNFPDTELNVPSITDYDWQCVSWAVANGVDFLALSFVRKADDVTQLRARLEALRVEGDPRIPIVPKIEKPEALRELEPIIEVADAVMVARGDLGVELDVAEVPAIQKRIIDRSHDYGKPVIVATQMLQSMIEESTPTRAEVSDVANAIYDGADSVMLSGETAVGLYPEQAVHYMARIAETTFVDIQQRRANEPGGKPPRRLRESRYRTAALAHGVSTMVKDLEALAIVVWSQHGGGARYLSQNRPLRPIVAFTSSMAACRQMTLYYGVFPVYVEQPPSQEEFLKQVDRWMIARQWGEPGDPLVVVLGEPLGTSGVTNIIRVHYLGDAAET